MAETLAEKYAKIRQAALTSEGRDPVRLAREWMKLEGISMHGPEHHFLDGAAFLMAYVHAGGETDPEKALDELAERTLKMPGAMCGRWGICGAVASVGAALSVIHGTTPLSTDECYREHMAYTSSVIAEMAKIGGPRCCKHNAFLALSRGAAFVRKQDGVPMETNPIVCEFSAGNPQCLGARCPFHG